MKGLPKDQQQQQQQYVEYSTMSCEDILFF